MKRPEDYPMNKFLTKQGLIVLLLISLAGCGSDMDGNDYKKEQVAQYVSKTKPVVGIFRGNLSKANNESMGEIKLEFQTNTTVSPAVNGPFPDRMAVFRVNISVYQSGRLYFSFPQGFFDP